MGSFSETHLGPITRWRQRALSLGTKYTGIVITPCPRLPSVLSSRSRSREPRPASKASPDPPSVFGESGATSIAPGRRSNPGLEKAVTHKWPVMVQIRV